MNNKLLTLAICLLLPASLIGCNGNTEYEQKDISIIYTTDVHCGIEPAEGRLGYTSLVSYKEKLEKTNYVSLVDAGDFLQGEFVGAISNGKYIIDIMNEAKYDVVTLGNHEFDYGMVELENRLNEFNEDVVSCNLKYVGTQVNHLSKVKPYVIKEYGHTKIGYVGITTPHTLVTSSPNIFIEEDNVVYDFGSSSLDHFYSVIQKSIDDCKKRWSRLCYSSFSFRKH